MASGKNAIEMLPILIELAKEKCRDNNLDSRLECDQLLEIFFNTVEKMILIQNRRRINRYEWIDKVIEKGLPDGRKRFILYVLSAYLVNIRNLSEEEAIAEVKRFLDNSCRNYGNCEKIYESWIRSDLARVKRKGLRPARLEKLDNDLREHIRKIVGS